MSGELLVCDTNVAVVANGDAPQASAECQEACISQLERLMSHGRLALDSLGLILQEYTERRPFGWPRSVGDRFIIWAVTHQGDPNACETVPIRETAGPRQFEEFPDDPALAAFDPSDHKFVAVAIASDEPAPVLNATDTDWRDYEEPLAEHGVEVRFLCPELMEPES